MLGWLKDLLFASDKSSISKYLKMNNEMRKTCMKQVQIEPEDSLLKKLLITQ